MKDGQPAKFRKYLTDRFSLSELKGFAFDIGIKDAESLPHTNKDDFARELIVHSHRTKKFNDLIEMALAVRPNVEISQLLQQLKPVADDDKPTNPPKPDEELFDAGDRIRQIREDLQLNKSGFARLIGFKSDKEYDELENRQKECNATVLQKVNEITGASLEWLKYEANNYRYEPAASLTMRDWKDKLQNLKALRHQNRSSTDIYVLIEGERFTDVGIVAIVNDYDCGESKRLNRYKMLHIVLPVDFSQPMYNFNDTHIQHIFRFYKLLKELESRHEFIMSGRIITREESSGLYAGKEHPSEIIKNGFHDAMNWPEDILDLLYYNRKQEEYRKFYGDWFVEMQRYFRHAVKTEAEKAEDKN